MGSGPDQAGPPGRGALLLAQLASLLALGVLLGLLVPRTSPLTGLAGGLLAWVAVVASGAGRSWWRRRSRRNPHWAAEGPEILTRELVRTGVALLAVLFLVAPLTLWARVLSTWVLAAVTAGVVAALPVGVAVELHAVNAAAGVADSRRLWALAVGAVAVAALALSLLVALAGLAGWSRAFAWAGTAVAALAITAGAHVTTWLRGG